MATKISAAEPCKARHAVIIIFYATILMTLCNLFFL